MRVPDVPVQVWWPDFNPVFFSGVLGYARLLCFRPIVLQVILPELWDTAVDLFDASRAGVVSDRKRTQKVQEKVNIRCRQMPKRACWFARRIFLIRPRVPNQNSPPQPTHCDTRTVPACEPMRRTNYFECAQAKHVLLLVR